MDVRHYTKDEEKGMKYSRKQGRKDRKNKYKEGKGRNTKKERKKDRAKRVYKLV
jgi:hypothetical protein